MKLYLAILILTTLHGSDGAKILGLFPSDSHSHYTLAKALFSELARRGHEVTVITPYDEKVQQKNYRTIFIEEISKYRKSKYMKL